MGRRTDVEDDWDEEDEDSTIPCPHCQREIHEETLRCPHCENYITQEETTANRKPWWMILGVLAVLYVMYRWIAG